MNHTDQQSCEKEGNVHRCTLEESESFKDLAHGQYEGLGEIIQEHRKYAFLTHHKKRHQRARQHCKKQNCEKQINEIDRQYQKKFQKLFRLSENQ